MKSNKIVQKMSYLYALLSALLFGASTPITKTLLNHINPWLLAGIFYLGSGLGLYLIIFFRYLFSNHIAQETPLALKDWPWLLAQIIMGGILAPILLMLGISHLNAAAASLLLNLETVFSVLIAWIFFREHTDFRIILGVLLIIIATLILTWSPAISLNDLIGPLLIAAACLAWAIDNNFARKIAAADPLSIVSKKSLIAGGTNTLLAYFFHASSLPHIPVLLISGLVGFFSYGCSLVFFILGLRHIGTARTSAFFALAPIVGVILSWLFLGENLTGQIIIAGLLMLAGVWLHLTEHHSHEHGHKFLAHEHLHKHDEHHQHEHAPHDPSDELHAHWHTHQAMTHTHPHFPDLHHEHKH